MDDPSIAEISCSGREAYKQLRGRAPGFTQEVAINQIPLKKIITFAAATSYTVEPNSSGFSLHIKPNSLMLAPPLHIQIYESEAPGFAPVQTLELTQESLTNGSPIIRTLWQGSAGYPLDEVRMMFPVVHATLDILPDEGFWWGLGYKPDAIAAQKTMDDHVVIQYNGGFVPGVQTDIVLPQVVKLQGM